MDICDAPIAGLLRAQGGLHSRAVRSPLLLPRLRGAVRAVSRVPRPCGAEDQGHQRVTEDNRKKYNKTVRTFSMKRPFLR